jgi:predicted Zn-dependent protease
MAEAQTSHLPKAGFPVLTTPAADNGEANEPTAMGLHLTPGLDRNPHAAIEPYNPGEPSLSMKLVRWEKQKMPLLIWISPGLKLPDCSINDIPQTRVDQVTSMLQQPGTPFSDLNVAPGWTPEVNDQVACGIEEWREFENEGLFSFAFTDNPRDAHICVFFTDAFQDASAPGGINVGGITSAQVYPVAQAHAIKIRQKPVVIELSTLVNSESEKMTGAAAHEFGHALGIKAHSPYREDTMNVDRVVNNLSPADKATIRWLYHKPPQMVM